MTGRPLVLMGFADALAAIETAWSLRAAGFDILAFSRAGSKPTLRRLKGLRMVEVCPPELDASATRRDLERVLRASRPDAILPLDDHAVWTCSRVELGGAVLAGPIGAGAELALNKEVQLAAAGAAGLLVPPTHLVAHLDDVASDTWPVVVKPALALYEAGGVLIRPTAVVCADAGELRAAGTKPRPGPLLVQPLIVGTGEGLFGHAGSAAIVGWSSHRRVRMVNPQGSASSACASTPVDRALVPAAERFLAGWRGLFMLEFLRDRDGLAWFMELNGRTWGSLALARDRGFEYPAWTVAAALDDGFQPPVPASPPEVRCRHLGMELVHLAFVMRGPQSTALTTWPTPRRAARQVLSWERGDRFYNWNRAEPGALAVDTFSTLRAYAGRFRRRTP